MTALRTLTALTNDDVTIPDGVYGATVHVLMRQPKGAVCPDGWTWRCGFGMGVHDGVQWYDNLYFRHFGEGGVSENPEEFAEQ